MAIGTGAVGSASNCSVTVLRSSKERAAVVVEPPSAVDQKTRRQSFWVIAANEGLSALGGVARPFCDIAEAIAAMTQRK